MALIVALHNWLTWSAILVSDPPWQHSTSSAPLLSENLSSALAISKSANILPLVLSLLAKRSCVFRGPLSPLFPRNGSQNCVGLYSILKWGPQHGYWYRYQVQQHEGDNVVSSATWMQDRFLTDGRGRAAVSNHMTINEKRPAEGQVPVGLGVMEACG